MASSRIALAASIGLPPPMADQAVAGCVAITTQPRENIVLGGFACDVVIDDRLLSQRAGHLGQKPRRDQPGIGHDQRAGDPQPGQLGEQQPAAPAPKRMRLGK